METGSKSSDASVKKKESHTKYVTKSSPKSVHWKSGLPNQKRKRKSSQKDGKIFIEDSKNGANVEKIKTEEVERGVSCPTEMDSKRKPQLQDQPTLEQSQPTLEQSQSVLEQNQSVLEQSQSPLPQRQRTLSLGQPTVSQNKTSLFENQRLLSQDQTTLLQDNGMNEIVDGGEKGRVSLPIEKDSKQTALSQESPAREGRGSVGGLPVTIVDNCEGTETDSSKEKEDASEIRKRKLKIKMKYANAFKSLFESVRSRSTTHEKGLNSGNNAGDAKIANTKEKAQLSHKTSGLTLKPFRDVTIARASSPSFEIVAESKKYMVPSENIKVINEKRQNLFGQQPWLLGRLALSRESARFQLPMNFRILEGLSPMEYLTSYCVISSRRKSLYRSTFQRFDKDRDGLLSFKDLIKALRNLHVNFIDKNELDELCKMLNLDNSSKARYDKSMFAAVAAFSERLIIHMREMSGKSRVVGNHLGALERADFYNIKGKLKDIDVSPALMNILQVL